MSELKVAIVHNWLWNMRGAERSLEVILDIYPDAQLYSLFGVDNDGISISEKIRSRNPRYSWLNRIPGIKRFYKYSFPLWPIATEMWDLSSYDLVISSSSSTVKGVIVGLDTYHVSYMYTPMRYLWDQKDLYKQKMGPIERFLFSIFANPMRVWDLSSNNRIDKIIAISDFVNKRIEKYYDRSADTVIYPPVDVETILGYLDEDIDRKDGYVMVSGFQENKGADIAIRYAVENNIDLTLIGDGPSRSTLEIYAKGYGNIKFVGWVSEQEKYGLIQRSRGLLFFGVEDFGIVPIESALMGTPVLAYGVGGALESVSKGITGVFINDLTDHSIKSGLTELDRNDWDRAKMHEFAREFDVASFKKRFLEEAQIPN